MRDSAAGATIGGARALHDARRDQQHGVLGQAAGQAGDGEGDQADDEHAAPAEQVSGPAAKNKKAAERDGVSRHDPLDCIGGHMKFALDRRQRDVHDAEIEDDHERGDEDEGQLQRLAAGRGSGRGLGVAVVGSGWLEGAVTGMIPIRYVTDRFGYPHDRTRR